MAIDQAFWTAEAKALTQLLLPLVTAAATAGATSALDGLPPAVGIDTELVNAGVLKWARSYTAGLVKDITKTTRELTQEAIAAWVESGEPLSSLVADLETHFGERRSETVAVTEVTRAFAAGNQTAWQASGVVEGMVWMTTEDDRVCEICGPLAGQELPIDSEEIPPAHVRCRCWVKPMVKLP